MAGAGRRQRQPLWRRSARYIGGIYANPSCVDCDTGVVALRFLWPPLGDSVGRGRFGAIAFAIDVLGHLIFVAAEIHSLSQRATSDLLPLGAIVSAVGLRLTGVTVLRAKQWQGWTRWVPS